MCLVYIYTLQVDNLLTISYFITLATTLCLVSLVSWNFYLPSGQTNKFIVLSFVHTWSLHLNPDKEFMKMHIRSGTTPISTRSPNSIHVLVVTLNCGIHKQPSRQELQPWLVQIDYLRPQNQGINLSEEQFSVIYLGLPASNEQYQQTKC